MGGRNRNFAADRQRQRIAEVNRTDADRRFAEIERRQATWRRMVGTIAERDHPHPCLRCGGRIRKGDGVQYSSATVGRGFEHRECPQDPAPGFVPTPAPVMNLAPGGYEEAHHPLTAEAATTIRKSLLCLHEAKGQPLDEFARAKARRFKCPSGSIEAIVRQLAADAPAGAVLIEQVDGIETVRVVRSLLRSFLESSNRSVVG